jgi:hypothetical protein
LTCAPSRSWDTLPRTFAASARSAIHTHICTHNENAHESATSPRVSNNSGRAALRRAMPTAPRLTEQQVDGLLRDALSGVIEQNSVEVCLECLSAGGVLQEGAEVRPRSTDRRGSRMGLQRRPCGTAVDQRSITRRCSGCGRHGDGLLPGADESRTEK